jgi:hypothetical protein
MLDLNDFFYFVQAVERGGFTAAGRALGMPKSTLSYRMQQLESELGVRCCAACHRYRNTGISPNKPRKAAFDAHGLSGNIAAAAHTLMGICPKKDPQPLGAELSKDHAPMCAKHRLWNQG